MGACRRGGAGGSVGYLGGQEEEGAQDQGEVQWVVRVHHGSPWAAVRAPALTKGPGSPAFLPSTARNGAEGFSRVPAGSSLTSVWLFVLSCVEVEN